MIYIAVKKCYISNLKLEYNIQYIYLFWKMRRKNEK